MKTYVVTETSPPGGRGNLATGIGQLYLDPQAVGGESTDDPIPLHEVPTIGMVAMFVQVPVFQVGEILVLDGNDRDQFGRKPFKWDVQLEEFDDPEAAFRRALEVAGTPA